MSENVLIIGGGGREHALAWKLSQSSHVKNVFLAPGSSSLTYKCVNINIKDFQDVANYCKTNNISLVVVGPEDPLASGISDALISQGIPVFGPQKAAAQIESSKEWAKAFMDRHDVPTARWKAFTDAKQAKAFVNTADFPALVVKASGLAAGKGVIVAANKQEACTAVDDILTDKKFGTAGESVVIEELLIGEEVSVLSFCDGKTVKAMLPAQDHKRIFDRDQGPNTGGMGAYCPCPLVTEEQMDYIDTHVLQKTVNGLIKENIKFVGVLYAGLILTKDGPKVLEFNCRFGDPETEVLLPLLESDLFTVMKNCCNGTLASCELRWKKDTVAVGVVMASKGYPLTSSKGQIITGVENVSKLKDHIVFQCGTTIKDKNLVTNGGRVLMVVALAPQLVLASARATYACEIIQFDGKQHRRDIAHKGISRSILQSGSLTYKASGVDISAGDSLVDYIKPLAKTTQRSGVLGSIGGFGGLFDCKLAGYQNPLLVSGTDGVGTKLKIAQEIGIHDTIGIDLVAMCVNDVLAHGAEPLFFLDYFACGNLDVELAKQVTSGIARGCGLAGCALIGGETAEMPDMYPKGEYDLAGFSVGAVEPENMLPNIEEITEGDVIIGLPSSGIHSNGFSLVRKVVKMSGVSYNEIAPFSESGKTFGEELLVPTKIYVNDVKQLIKNNQIKAFAHITGGGLIENIPRVLSKTLAVELDAKKWKIPKVFGWLAASGGINSYEMLRTFNCGVGAILIIKKQEEADVLNALSNSGATTIGYIKKRQEDLQIVNVKNFVESMEIVMSPFVPKLMSAIAIPKKRVGVLISGSGTNLQALINATLDPTKHMGCEIVLVISNKVDVGGLIRAQNANIPTKVISHKDYPTRVEYDKILHAELLAAGVEIVCLAGFMRILSGQFTQNWKGRLLNIHPSLLPLFKGANAWKQALEAGVRVTGCSVHFVEEDIDAGAIIVQQTVPIEWNDTEESLLNRIHTVEHQAYPYALKLLATGKVKLGSDNKLRWTS